MISIVKINFRLGNQMFQYAFAKALAKKKGGFFLLNGTGMLLKHNTGDSHLYRLGIFNIKNTFWHWLMSRFLNILAKVKLYKITEYREDNFRYTGGVFKETANFFMGYWQSEKYFNNIESDLRKDFSFKNKLSLEAGVYADGISKDDSVVVSFRRGDYLLPENKNKYTNLLETEYYETAIKSICEKVDNPTFYVFSDDIDEARFLIEKKGIFSNYHVLFINIASDLKLSDDLQLMSMCKNHIMANSTFSWWAAWLNRSNKKNVIAPKALFTKGSGLSSEDLIPDCWLRL